MINTVLGAHFPTDPIVGEEDATDLRGSAPGATDLRAHVHRLANEALRTPEADCPAVQAGQQQEGNKWGSGEVSEEKLLAAIDRGNYGGGSKGRKCALDDRGYCRRGACWPVVHCVSNVC